MTLVEDTVSSVAANAVSADDIAAALPYSYTAYSSYIPSYDEIKSRYLSLVAELVNQCISSSFAETVITAGAEAAENPTAYISGEMITPFLRAMTEEVLEKTLTAYLDEEGEAISSAFSESEDTFSRVKKAYSSLSAVSRAVILPLVREIDITAVVSLSVDRYFFLLTQEETRLRSNPLYWRGNLYEEN